MCQTIFLSKIALNFFQENMNVLKKKQKILQIYPSNQPFPTALKSFKNCSVVHSIANNSQLFFSKFIIFIFLTAAVIFSAGKSCASSISKTPNVLGQCSSFLTGRRYVELYFQSQEDK